jgi:opacity protein-like surface antigen
MKRLLVLVFLGLGSVCAAYAQGSAAAGQDTSKSARVDFASTSAASVTLVDAANTKTLIATSSPDSVTPGFSRAFATPNSSATFAEPAASPAPAPEPKFIFGGRDDYRWQIGLGATWIRFRSSIFNASAVGVKTSLTYFTNDWFAIEGNVSAGFAPEIFQNEHVKVLVYGAGPKIAWRQKRWEPWAHAIFGGVHEQPQTAAGGKNAFAAQLGGGADYRFNPRLSGRLEGDYIRTSLFTQSQNNFQLTGGFVFHF